MYIVLYGELYDIMDAYRVCIMYVQIKELHSEYKKTSFTFIKIDLPPLSLHLSPDLSDNTEPLTILIKGCIPFFSPSLFICC